MRAPSPVVAATSLFVSGLVLYACGGGGDGGGRVSDWDVRGNYALTWDDRLKLTLNVGGAVREATAQGYGEVVDFGTWEGQPLRLDLKAFCDRPDVHCPSEAFWTKVAIDQQDVTRKQDLHVINVIDDTEHTPPAGRRAEVRGGLVDHAQKGQFLIGLGGESGGNENCGALAISLAGGRFSRAGERLEDVTAWQAPSGKPCDPDAGTPDAGHGDPDAGTAEPDAGTSMPTETTCTEKRWKRLVYPDGARVDGIRDGKVALGWFGACAFGPVVAGATLTLETGFEAVRTGDFDPPPFTPEPATLPEEVPDAGSGADAGG